MVVVHGGANRAVPAPVPVTSRGRGSLFLYGGPQGKVNLAAKNEADLERKRHVRRQATVAFEKTVQNCREKPTTARLFQRCQVQIPAGPGPGEGGGADQPGICPQNALARLLPTFCRERVWFRESARTRF
jgi:hypothetical protein